MPDEETHNLPALPKTPMQMLATAINSGASADVLEKLLGLQERWEGAQAKKAFAAAISKAKGQIGPVFKRREARMGSGRPNYTYEALSDIEKAIVGPLSEVGLSYRWGTRVSEARPDWVTVVCRVEHKDGWSEENSLAGPIDMTGAKNALQGIGSALSYLQRYSLRAALGLSVTDDDTDAHEPVEPITEQELVQLRARIEQAGQTEERVCREPAIDIAKLEDLPRTKFEPVMRRLAINLRERNAAAQRGMEK